MRNMGPTPPGLRPNTLSGLKPITHRFLGRPVTFPFHWICVGDRECCCTVVVERVVKFDWGEVPGALTILSWSPQGSPVNEGSGTRATMPL